MSSGLLEFYILFQGLQVNGRSPGLLDADEEGFEAITKLDRSGRFSKHLAELQDRTASWVALLQP